jgi:hypothetical protein
MKQTKKTNAKTSLFTVDISWLLRENEKREEGKGWKRGKLSCLVLLIDGMGRGY